MPKRYLEWHAALSTPLLLVLLVGAFTRSPRDGARFDEITVEQVNVVDSLGNVRVMLAGGFPPRRAELAGLLFVNPDGSEAGGLVYAGKEDADGKIEAGAILTFDQYRNDQIMALQYNHTDGRKRVGMTFKDRPDTLSDLVKEAYRAVQSAPDKAARDSLRDYYFSIIPPEEIVAGRVFIGRDYGREATLTLSDPSGRPRLALAVDSLGQARISFLDEGGEVIRQITP